MEQTVYYLVAFILLVSVGLILTIIFSDKKEVQKEEEIDIERAVKNML